MSSEAHGVQNLPWLESESVCEKPFPELSSCCVRRPAPTLSLPVMVPNRFFGEPPLFYGTHGLCPHPGAGMCCSLAHQHTRSDRFTSSS